MLNEERMACPKLVCCCETGRRGFEPRSYLFLQPTNRNTGMADGTGRVESKKEKKSVSGVNE